MKTGRGGGEHRRAERHRLLGGRHRDVHVHHVRHRLHDERALVRDAADRDARPRSGSPTTESARRSRASRTPSPRPARGRCRGASVPSWIPVIAPLSRWLASGVRRPFIQSSASTALSPGGIASAARSSSGMIRSVHAVIKPLARRRVRRAELGRHDFERPAKQLLEPGVHVAKRRLPGLVANHARQHRAVDLAADAGDQRLRLLGSWRHQDVAGAGPHHLEQLIRLDAAADRAHVRVERAHRDDRRARNPQLVCPFVAHGSERRLRRPGLGAQRRLEPRQARMQLGEKLVGRVAAELRVPHRLVPGRAAAAADLRQVARAREHRRDPVAVLEHGDRRLRHAPGWSPSRAGPWPRTTPTSRCRRRTW